jgi:hypothetical protein
LPKQVILHHTNETGKWLWIIVDADNKEMWLYSFSDKESAINCCIANNLELIRLIDDFKEI